jgi:hypothetical protein
MLSFAVAFALYLALTALLALWMGQAKSWLAAALLMLTMLIGIPWLASLP